jgi:hypothetical protein
MKTSNPYFQDKGPREREKEREREFMTSNKTMKGNGTVVHEL